MKLKFIPKIELVHPRFLALSSIMDALVSSGTMFCVQGFLIYFGSQPEFGLFSVSVSYIFMGQMVLSAIFGPPLITVITSLPEEQRSLALSYALRVQALLVLIIGLLVTPLVAYIVYNATPFAAVWWMAAFWGLSIREIQRVSWAISLRPHVALASSCAFAIAVPTVLLVFIVNSGSLDSAAGFAALGIASLAAIALPLWRVIRTRPTQIPGLSRQILGFGKWTLPGVLAAWMQNSAYLTILAAETNLTVVAQVAAARLFIMPYSVAAGGLLRLNQVMFGQKIPDLAGMRSWRLAMPQGLAHLGACSLLAVALLVLSEMRLLEALLPRNYAGILKLGSLWFIFAGIVSARSVFTALLQSQGRYQAVFFANLLSLPVGLGGLFVLVPRVGAAGAILPLIVAEGVFMTAIIVVLARTPQEE